MVRLLVVLTLVSLPLAAADWPAAELSAGPSYLRVAGEVLYGGQVGLAVNRREYLSLVGSFGYHRGNAGLRRAGRAPGRCDGDDGHASDGDRDADRSCPAPLIFVPTGVGDVYTYLGGLRLRRTAGRLTLFAQGQAGGARIGGRNGLALAAGGGAQVALSQRFAIEARVGYLPLRFAGGWVDDNVRATVGLVIRFGPWWGGYRRP